MVAVGERYRLLKESKSKVQLLTSNKAAGAVVEVLNLPTWDWDDLCRVRCVKTGEICCLPERSFIKKVKQ